MGRSLAVLTILGAVAGWMQPALTSESRTSFGGNEHLVAGAAALRGGDHEEGIRLTLLGLEEFPGPLDRAAGLSNLCGGYVSTGRYELAIRYCDDAMSLNDRNWRTYHNRALAYLRQGILDEAITDLEAGLRLSPHADALIRTLAAANELRYEPQIIMQENRMPES